MNPETPNGSGSRGKLKIFTAVIALVIAAVFIFVLCFLVRPPKIIVDADAGFRIARQTIDPEKLRAWALASIQRWPNTNGMQTMPESEIPQYIKTLYAEPPEIVMVFDDVVDIEWGKF